MTTELETAAAAEAGAAYDPFHEPLVTYAYLAGITRKLELVTGVIILPQRQTALFAARRKPFVDEV